MSKISKYVLIGIALIVLISTIIPGYIFPADVLNNIPSFSEQGWTRPKNSLEADPVYQFEPWRAFSKQSFLHGQFPLWNNLNGGGVPLFANMQSAVLFPLNLLYYFFPTRIAINSIPLLKLFFFCYLMYLYLRSIRIRQEIAILGAVAATFSGYMVLWLFWPHTNVYLLLPLLLLLTEKLTESRKQSYRWYIAIALTYFVGILGGHPETLFHITLLHSIYSIFRLWDEKKKLVPFFFSVVFGFILGAVQIFPFLEYLKNSYILEKRTMGDQQFYIPFTSFIMNFFPFILGAPHQQYYRPINQHTNLQEVLGGYVGPIILISSAAGFIFFRKKKLEMFWAVVVVISWLLSYKIWPFWYINTLPVLSTSANQRLVAFAGFGMVVLFCLFLNRILGREKLLRSNKLLFANNIYIFLLVLAILAFLILNFKNPLGQTNYAQVSPYILNHIFFIAVTTVLFFWMLVLFIQKKISERPFFIGLILFVLAQTLLLFWNYNPVIPRTSFYPDIPIVDALKKHPQGSILEIGNPSLPPDVNIMYGIPNSLNNDAIDVRWYKHAFDKEFPIKNHWDNPDTVSAEAVKRLGISYILSDYDITLEKKTVIPNAVAVLHPITKSNPYKYEIANQEGLLRQIRFRTANFNRVNTCKLLFTFEELPAKSVLAKTEIPCNQIRDNVFYTLAVSPTEITKNVKYQITITSNSDEKIDAVALWGENNKPFTEFLFDTKISDKSFTLLTKTKTTYLWRSNDYKLVEGAESFSILYQDPQRIIIYATSDKPTNITIKETYYSGWNAIVNGRKETIANGNPFMQVPIDKGRNYIELRYHPLSFMLGLLISLASFFVGFIYILRKENVFDMVQRAGAPLVKTANQIAWYTHVSIFTISIISLTVIFAVLVKLIPIHFTNPWSLSITWYTVHSYPKVQDYFYFYSGVSFVTIGSILVWLFIVWRKKLQ